MRAGEKSIFLIKQLIHMFKRFVAFAALFLLMLLPVITMAQDPCVDPDLDPPCPIDGGLSLLIAAGIGIGAKKAYDKKKQRTSVEL
ncbi:MAG: hypothetical protein JWQ27_191 [Ferruginibacter sp.]|nr:hypothetical protein [Ferruginibacter sp.]